MQELARCAGIGYAAWFPATYEPVSANKIVWSELEGLFLRNEELNVLATSSEADDGSAKSLVCTIL